MLRVSEPNLPEVDFAPNHDKPKLPNFGYHAADET